jgi:DNA-binding MarR family transcriptional regulator
MTRRKQAETVQLESLDLGYLAFFVGMRINELVLEAVHAAGFTGLRHAHGFVVQHLLGGARSIGELAALLGVTQQAASKTVAELKRYGLLEPADSDDARVHRVQLSAAGRLAVDKSRSLRVRLHERLEREHGSQAIAEARALLAGVLSSLGGAEAVRTRRIRAPK